MRQIVVKVSSGQGEPALALARRYDAQNATIVETAEQYDLLLAHLPNRSVGDLLRELEAQSGEMEATLDPHAVLPLAVPAENVPSYITNVQPRSPLEIWLNAQQSVGPWLSFLGYAAAGSIIAWIAMFTNSVYLLVAAMLVSPFAGPAMNTALSTAVGDRSLLQRSIGRYFGSLALTIVLAGALSLLLGLETATNMMVSVSEVSAVAVLLPLIAGAAGAMNLAQAENSSLVSGTAVGVLVAASLAPPAALIGMAAALQRWDLAVNGVFVLLLQLAAINLSGAITFRAYGLRPQGAQFQRGQPLYFYGSLLVSLAALAGLLAWQFSDTPALQHATRSQRALAVAERVIAQDEDVRLVEANFRFTRPVSDQQGSEALLGIIYVEQVGDTAVPELIEEAIAARLLAEGFEVKPLVTVTVLEPPP